MTRSFLRTLWFFHHQYTTFGTVMPYFFRLFGNTPFFYKFLLSGGEFLNTGNRGFVEGF